MVETMGQDGSHKDEAAHLRLVTAASLFDATDAAIHIMRCLIQTHATEVIHLGHNRSASEVVRAALQEDADAIVVSSHQGGHVEYFTCMIDLLLTRGAGHIPVFVSSNAPFPADDIAALEACGVACVYHTPADFPQTLPQLVADLIARTHQAHEKATRSQAPSTAASAPLLPPQRENAGYTPTIAAAATTAADAGSVPPPVWWPGAHSKPPVAAPATPLVPNEIRLGVLGQPGAAARLVPSPLPGMPPSPAVYSPSPSAPGQPTPGRAPLPSTSATVPAPGELELTIGRMLTRLENEHPGHIGFHELRKRPPWTAGTPPVIGITGTGGAGKSSVTDELLMRFLANFPKMRIAVLSVDPTRRRSGGALLGDRIRMNALRSPRVYMRSMATRRQNMATSAVLQNCIQYLKGQDFDLVIVETAGIGQSDSTIVDLVDLPVYVMTSDYGAASQLEKIDMLDFAELIVLNKYDHSGAADALRDIRRQWRRNRQAYDLPEDRIPVYPTIASQCNDPGMNWMFVNLCRLLHGRQPQVPAEQSPQRPRCDFNPCLDIIEKTPNTALLIPPPRAGYLAEIAEQGRTLNARIHSQVQALTRAQQCWQALAELNDASRPAALAPYPADALGASNEQASVMTLRRGYHAAISAVSPDALQRLREWPHHQYAEMSAQSLLAGTDLNLWAAHAMPAIAAPRYTGWGDVLRFLARENLPGEYPYTSGIQTDRQHARHQVEIIANEGTPERANRQWHAARQGQAEIRLTAVFDSVTAYGEDPDERLDIQGKIGHGGVSIPTLDAMKKLYSGFDLCAPGISVAMAVNGPAPILVAMLVNTAIDQQVEHYLKQDPLRWQQAQQSMETFFKWRPRPDYDAELPPGHDTSGLGLLGISGDQLVDADTYARIKAHTLSHLHGRVRIDVLEQDQANNTCIFSPEFSLRMLGDMQHYCVEHGARQLHLLSASGAGFAALGATPITQLAFALANGLTLVEYCLARGLVIDQIAPALRFFFSIGDELEYSVLGRVARRIWARAMRERYDASPDGQQLKYDIDASGRSGDARHVILSRELGVDLCENPWQGSFIIDALTDLVEEAVYLEFEALSSRGGVLGAMGSLYQRDKIQDEWMQRARRTSAHGMPLPRMGAATDTSKKSHSPLSVPEKTRQIANVQLWNGLRNALSPGSLHSGNQATVARADGQEHPQSPGLSSLQHAARGHGNVFAVLMEAVKTHSLGQITHALYAAGGEYRRTV